MAAIMLMAMAVFTVGCNNSTNNGGDKNGDEKSSSTENNGNTNNDHEWVDLGLPSGTLWATCNVGATKPEEYGDYFAWGETKQKNIYNLDTYRYCNNGDVKQLTKYCSDLEYGYHGFTDNLTVL